jgi:L-cysteine:1D-myo-inositol 2-amino-2-deoxy-alpha-D-glucopyranoside ligase
MLYNTLTKALEKFQPSHDPVRIYVCGVTPYDTTHLGHAFTFVIFDTLIRYLRWQGYGVKYVQNITDVDDDILRRAAELGEPYRQLGNRYLDELLRNMEQLNVLNPEARPRATEEIAEMAEIVGKLLAHGVAYRLGDKVYFRTNSWPEYGRLSGLGRDEMLALARQRGAGDLTDVPGKEDPLDFVLWQGSKPGEPFWDTPIGPGRPGWHVECSAMCLKHLGDQLDIHGGGKDLVFPHHESEIPQSETFTGVRPFARFWCHTSLVHLGGQPMSKSQGNMLYVSDLLKAYSPAAVRLLLLSHHYREDWEYDEAELKESEGRVRQIAHAMSLKASLESRSADPKVRGFEEQFKAAMDQDLDTPTALNVISHLVESIIQGSGQGPDVGQARSKLVELCRLLGLDADMDGIRT